MESNIIENKKRPGWVWAISIFYFFTAAYVLLAFYLIYTGKISIPPEYKAYFDGLTRLDIGSSIFIGLLNLIGATLLFFNRKQAFYFFVVSLVINVLMFAWSFSNKGFIETLGLIGLMGAFIGWGMLLAVCVYTKRLEKTGYLK